MKNQNQKVLIRSVARALLLGLLTLLSAEFSRAAVYTWTSTTGGTTTTDGAGTWGTGNANWRLNNAGTAVVWPNNQDAIIGAGGTPGTITLSGNPVINNITFNTVASGNYILTASTLRIGSAANQSVTWTVNSGVTIDLGNGGGSGTYLREGAGNNGIIFDAGGTVLLSYTGTATPFTGPATIQGGTAVFVGAGYLVAGSSNILTSGKLGSFNSTGRVFTKPTALKGNFTLGAPSPRNGDLTFTNTTTWQLNGGTWTLTVDTITVTNNAVINQDGSSRGLTFASANGGKLVLNNTETYTGPTTVNSGKLALGASGVLNAASGVTIAAGATFDVTALTTYTLGSSATLSASGTGTTVGTDAANIKGGTTVDLGTRPIALTFTPTGFSGDTTHPSLYLESGTLSLGGNAFTVNNASATPLGAGTYRIAQTGGSITTSGIHTVTVTGTGLNPSLSAAIQVNNTVGMVDLVVTASCTPGTNYSVTGGGTICSGDPGVLVGLAGSDTGVDYQLKRNGSDVGSPLAGTGAAISFGLQNIVGSYTVNASNTATFCTGGMTGIAAVAVNALPGISTQPVAATVQLGASANFSVVATGSGLTYQWRHDGTNISNGGSISGATSNVMTINPAAASDTSPAPNGYDVVVSGTCSPATNSTRVALTVQLPNNLVWVGDSVSNRWDTVTANWTGDATVFNTNDYVTFTNTGSTTPAVDLVGVISPGIVTVNSTQNYTIGSTVGGSLGGIATLSKAGSGKLTLSSANTFTGKATVTGGTLSIANGGNLGAAPGAFVADQLTLNGGALEVTVSGNITANRGVTIGASGGTFTIPTGILYTNTPVITGAGSLTKTDTGTLVLPVANSYIGGTVVSNGTLAISSTTALGSGALVLAGGSLNPLSSLNAVTNDIVLTADSTITGGNIAPQFSGALSGSAGTLTISGTTATFAPRLLGAFTFNRPLSLATATTSLRIYNTNTTETFNGIISGSGNIHRRSTVGGVGGETILNGDNTYSGGTTLTEGVLGFGISSTGSPTVTSGPIGTGTLTYGDSGNSSNSVRTLYALGGIRTVGNNIVMSISAPNQTNVVAGVNDLTLSGTMDLGGTNRLWVISNSGVTTFSGNISNGSLTKEGSGMLLVNGNDTLGALIINQGPMGGTGVITGPLTNNVGGTLAPGISGIGTLTVNNNLTLLGVTAVDINKTSATSDLVTGIGTANYGGSLTINNLSGTLAAADSFTLFSATTHSGTITNFSPATPGAGLAWSFTNGVLSVVTSVSVNTTPTNIVYSVSGPNEIICWPTDHIGWRLQVQTNSLAVGLGTNWVNVAVPNGYSCFTNTLNPANQAVFYRMVYP